LFRSNVGGKHLMRLYTAFKRDGFEIEKIVKYKGKRGILAKSRSILNYDTGKPKSAYYLEGSPYEMGYLMGSLAEREIALMMDYTDRVVFSFIGSKVLEKIKLIQRTLISLVYELSKPAVQKLPEEMREEIRGIYDGCKNINPKTSVNIEHLTVLNIGIDIICSMVYSGDFFKKDTKGIEPEDFRVPMMCNALTVCGKSAGDGYYFGRDFTFPSSDVFQDTAAPIIYNPEDSVSYKGRRAIPFVNIAAPGMIGSIAAMNLEGVALGVNMSPGANCTPGNVGINSLLMARMCAQYGSSAETAADLMAELPKGVSWLYIIADGKTGRSCAAEAGAPIAEENLAADISQGTGAAQSSDTYQRLDFTKSEIFSRGPDFTQYPWEEYRPMLPDLGYIREHATVPYHNGVMFRWNDYRYPSEYLAFNRRLWTYHNEKNKTDKAIHPDAFDEKGYINKTGEENCPSSFYFAPQREENDDILVVTNHYIIPEMRYFAMNRWTQRIVGKRVNDIQWRYDELNNLIHDKLRSKGSIGFEDARELISFLSPSGRNKDYHADNPRSRDGKQLRIEGCISVFDLKKKVVESHYGYFCDKWVRITLPEYFDKN